MSATDADPAAPHVAGLYRYPVKGLTAEHLNEADVATGGTVPFDRCYAIENGAGRFDPLQPQHLPKINFLMLMRNERMAALRASFDDLTETLTIYRDHSPAAKSVAKGRLSTPIGRQLIEQFLSSYFAKELRGPPRIVHAPDHSFCDVPVKCLHIVNLASVRELERVAGRTIDPLRFRANVYVEGAEPWSEFGWVGGDVRIGTAGLNVFARTERCAATDVDPGTAARDTSIPSLLQRRWGHTDFGVYAKVVTGGTIRTSDSVIPGAL